MIALGRILLAAGFLAGAFVSVRDSDHVAWPEYFPCVIAMVASLIILRIATSGSDVKEKAKESVATLERCIESLCTKLGHLRGALEEQGVFAIHGLIDAELVEELGTFADHREGLIRRYGMKTYADVMSAFALSERLINRCWSASADGYVDEVRRCLEMAEHEMESARTKLAAATSVD